MTSAGIVFLGVHSASAAEEKKQMRALEDQVDALQQQVAQITSGMAHHSDTNAGLPLHGFMDVGFATHTGNTTENKSFNVGALSLYLTPQFGDRVRGLVEPNFEVLSDGKISVDVERLQLGYTLNDHATAWGGRFHTPYGYWNTAFHHGSQMQTSILRPRFIDFEDKGGILPAHTVGLWTTGKTRTAGGKMTYDVYIGNRPSIAIDPATNLSTLDMNQAGKNNHQALIGFNVGHEFANKLDGLRLAVHGVRGNVDDTSTIPQETQLSVVGGSAVYLNSDWEALGEYYQFNNQDKSGNTGSHSSWAGYAQVGKSFNDWTPYVRLEHAVLSQQDSYFRTLTSGQSYARQSLGVRYEINPDTSLKFELLNSNFAATANRTGSGYRSLHVQYAVGF
jgi:hypothetical protein